MTGLVIMASGDEGLRTNRPKGPRGESTVGDPDDVEVVVVVVVVDGIICDIGNDGTGNPLAPNIDLINKKSMVGKYQ